MLERAAVDASVLYSDACRIACPLPSGWQPVDAPAPSLSTWQNIDLALREEERALTNVHLAVSKQLARLQARA